MVRVLFVCTGNTCRSPMAEAILKNKNITNVEVKSAGIFAINGAEASYQAQHVLLNKNMKHSHTSSLLTNELLDWATYVLTMTAGHKDVILSQHPSCTEKTFTLKEFAAGDLKGDVLDPFGGSVEQYERTFEELDLLIQSIVDKLEK